MSEHEDIARRLREEGAAQAPPDLADAVMAQVRAEPRQAEPRQAPPRWQPRWRPLLGWAAAAATLAAIGFGIAHLPSGTSSSSSSSSGASATHSAKAAAPETAQSGALHASSRIYTLSQDQLKAAPAPVGPQVTTSSMHGDVLTIRAPADRYEALARQLRGLERAYLASPHGHRLLVRLVRAGTR